MIFSNICSKRLKKKPDYFSSCLLPAPSPCPFRIQQERISRTHQPSRHHLLWIVEAMDELQVFTSDEGSSSDEDECVGIQSQLDWVMSLCINFLLLQLSGQLKKRRDWWIYPRQVSFWNDVNKVVWLQTGPAGKHNFRAFYRMSATNFECLLQLVIPQIPQAELEKMVREPMEKIKAVAVVIFRLAHNQKCFICAEMFGMGASTVHKYTALVVGILAGFKNDFIKPPTGIRLSNIMLDFESISGVPQIAGAIDGTHIQFRNAPAKRFRTADYWCRHHFHSIILQAVCDPSLIFWDVSCNAPGGVHDTRHFYISPLYAKLSRRLILQGPSRRLNGRRVQPYLIGDSGYPQSEFMMVVKRVKATDSADVIRFSKHLSQARVVVENSFAVLKGRWNILKDCPIQMPHAPKVVIACCVLHNFLQMQGEDERFEGRQILYGGEPLNQGETARRRAGKLLKETVYEHMRLHNLL